jgi:hypothetical protein
MTGDIRWSPLGPSQSDQRLTIAALIGAFSKIDQVLNIG